MMDMAAHLLDEVVPIVPVRQWVLTVPFPLRLRMSVDAALVATIRAALATAMRDRLVERYAAGVLGMSASRTSPPPRLPRSKPGSGGCEPVPGPVLGASEAAA